MGASRWNRTADTLCCLSRRPPGATRPTHGPSVPTWCGLCCLGGTWLWPTCWPPWCRPSQSWALAPHSQTCSWRHLHCGPLAVACASARCPPPCQSSGSSGTKWWRRHTPPTLVSGAGCPLQKRRCEKEQMQGCSRSCTPHGRRPCQGLARSCQLLAPPPDSFVDVLRCCDVRLDPVLVRAARRGGRSAYGTAVPACFLCFGRRVCEPLLLHPLSARSPPSSAGCQTSRSLCSAPADWSGTNPTPARMHPSFFFLCSLSCARCHDDIWRERSCVIITSQPTPGFLCVVLPPSPLLWPSAPSHAQLLSLNRRTGHLFSRLLATPARPEHAERCTMAKHHPDLIMCRKQPGIAIGRLCEKCDGKCVVCDSYVRPAVLVRICDECNYGSYAGRCVICSGIGVSDAYYCKECTIQEKDRDGCPKIINLGSAKTDLFYERKKYKFTKR